VYKNFWGIDIPDCHQLDVDAGGWSPEAFRWACRYALFDEPGCLQGHRYVKGSMHMAYCITEAGWDQAEAEAKLDALVQYKGELPCYVFSLHTYEKANSDFISRSFPVRHLKYSGHQPD
jgi:hypothetical protein